MSEQRERPPLGFESELEDLSETTWVSSPPKAKPSADLIKRAGESAGFSSREVAAPRQQRRRRTGRNAQFNIKTKSETITAFTAIADAHGWGLGEAFEIATELLIKKYDNT